MNRIKHTLLLLAMVPFLLGTAAAVARAQSPDALSKTPAWRPPAVEDVKARAFAWLDEHKADKDTRRAADELWSSLPDEPSSAELLECLAGTFALIDPNAAALVELCSRPKQQIILPEQGWLGEEKTPRFVAENMRLLYGRWLVQQTLYEESQEQLSGLEPGRVVAPAMLLFYQGVVHHRLLEKESGMAAIKQLLDGADGSPRRYVAVARLMQHDLQGLEEDTLDHIARRMDDIRRRLQLGRGGKRVRKVEDGVIESLDKLIKKIEEQQKQCKCGGASGNNIRSSSPAPDSQIIGGKGRGEVTKRNVGSESGWGDLPPKQREEALQQIGRDFPAHYRDVIEQYFRRLASEDSK